MPCFFRGFLASLAKKQALEGQRKTPLASPQLLRDSLNPDLPFFGASFLWCLGKNQGKTTPNTKDGLPPRSPRKTLRKTKENG